MTAVRWVSLVSLFAVGCGRVPELAVELVLDSDVLSISGTVNADARVVSEAEVSGVEFWLDDRRLGTRMAAPYSLPIDSVLLEEGDHVLVARATIWDQAQAAVSASDSVTFVVDNHPPSLSITAPVAGSVFADSETAMLIAASAVDPAGPVRVDLYIDGALVRTFDAPPFNEVVSLDDLIGVGQRTTDHTVRVEATSPLGWTAVAESPFSISRRILWQLELDSPAVGPLQATDDGIVVATANGEVRALDHDGASLWSYHADNPLAVGVTRADNGWLYFGDSSGRVYQISPTGELGWKLDLASQSGVVAYPPAVDGDDIFVALHDGRVYQVRTTTGTASPQVTLVAEHESASLVAIAVDRSPYGVIVLAILEDLVVAHGASAGGWEWTPAGRIAVSPTPGASGLLIADDGGQVVRVRQQYGGFNTEPVAHLGVAPMSPVVPVAGDGFIVVTGDGVVTEIAAGDVRWQTPPSSQQRTEPLVDGDRVYVAGTAGELHAYDRAAGGSLLWSMQLGAPVLAKPILAGPVLVVADLGVGSTAPTLYAVAVD